MITNIVAFPEESLNLLRVGIRRLDNREFWKYKDE